MSRIVSGNDRPRFRLLLGALLWIVPTAWFASLHANLEVDVENEALKSEGTREARDLELVEREFGSDHLIWLGFTAGPGLTLGESEHRTVREIAARLSELQGVERTLGPHRPDAGIDCLGVVLEAGDHGFAGAADRVLAALDEFLPPTLEAHATGQPLGELAIARSLEQERMRTVPLVAGALLLLLLAFYRSPRLALLAMLPAGVAIAWTGGLFELFGHRIDPIAVLIEPVVLTVGVAVSIHFVEAYLRYRLAAPAAQAARLARAELLTPTLLATATTMLGFLALLVSPIPALGRFGVYASLGVAIAAGFGISVLPGLLAAFGGDGRPARGIEVSAHAYANWLRRYRGRILTTLAVVTALLAVQWMDASVDNDPLRVLPRDSDFRRTTDEMTARLGGVESFGVLVPAARGAPDPDALALVGAQLLRHPMIVAVGPALRAANGDVLLRPTIVPSGSRSRAALFDEIERWGEDWELQGLRAVGSAVQIARDSERLIHAQLEGLLLLSPLLAFAIAIGLRSWRMGLLSLLPNALPSVLLYGSVTLIGQDLSVATVMIGSTMMGLIVDDTIHFLHRYSEAIQAGERRDHAVCTALRLSGRPITITSVLLAAGLGMGVLGALNSTLEFSLMASATVVIAWILDVVVLPALLLSHRSSAASRPETSFAALRPLGATR